jgi:BirA family biotin operon repressor/biotin-[acetyl-CoA-carboxylase] ligase
MHRHLHECASTNDVARQWASDASDPAPEWAVVTADFQTAGRGRRGRTWQSKGGENLLMSVVVRPNYPIEQGWRLGFVAAVAVAEALEEFGVATALKWPNDVLIDGRKVSGILVETVASFSLGWTGIIGVGVNVNQLHFAIDEGVSAGAVASGVVGDISRFEWEPTSLALARRDGVLVADVREAVLRRLQAVELMNRTIGFSAVAAAWRAKMAVGLSIRRRFAQQSGTALESGVEERGIQTSLLDDGAIVVRLPDGTFAHWRTVDREEPSNGV